MSKKRQELPELTPAQREIMEIVWERGEVSASEVRRALSQTRAVARNTVRTLLERIEEKGWLTHREDGRTFVYSAAQPRQATIGQKVGEIIDRVCGGSAEALVTALLDYRGLSSGELERIREMLAKAQATKRQKENP
jgi:BlaI family penicillinase repressor